MSIILLHMLTLNHEGMGGLCSALALAREGYHNIDIYEYAPNLGFVGAGIQMAPNLARILDKLGVWNEILSESVQINETSVLGMYLSSFRYQWHADEEQRAIMTRKLATRKYKG